MCWLLTTTRWKQCSILKKELPWNHHYGSILLFLFFLCHNFLCISLHPLRTSSHWQISKVIAYFFYYHRSSNISFYYHRSSNIFQHMTNDKNDKEIKMYKMGMHTNVYIYINKNIPNNPLRHSQLPYRVQNNVTIAQYTHTSQIQNDSILVHQHFSSKIFFFISITFSIK